MHCLAFRHLPHEGLGVFRQPLRERGWTLDERPIRVAEDVPAEAASIGVDLLIVLGGPMSASVPAASPAMVREIEILRERLDAGGAVLGVCLGAQMMAAALGARVYPGPRPEVGWRPVVLDPEGERDPSFAALLRPSGLALHWHEDTFDLPGEAVRLAHSELYANQAFRYRDLSYGVQFHPEVPPADLPEWVERSHIPLDRPPLTPSGYSIVDGGQTWGVAAARQAGAFLAAYLRRLEERAREAHAASARAVPSARSGRLDPRSP